MLPAPTAAPAPAPPPAPAPAATPAAEATPTPTPTPAPVKETGTEPEPETGKGTGTGTGKGKMTESEMTIRELNRGDKGEMHAVWSLINKTYRSADGWTHEKELVGGERLTKKKFDEYLSERNTTLFVALPAQEKDIIGCIKVQVDVKDTAVGPLLKAGGYFGMLAVAPKWQSRGIGNFLVKHAERKCMQCGNGTVYIDVLSERPELVRWYARHGYRIIAQSTFEEAEALIKGLKSKLLRPSRFILLSKTLS